MANESVSAAGAPSADQEQPEEQHETPAERLAAIFAKKPSLGYSKTLGRG